MDITLNEYREHLLNRVDKEIIPKIEKESMTAGVVETIEKGLEWYQMREKKLQEIEQKEKELEQLKKKWNA